jgi:hypothetical protein
LYAHELAQVRVIGILLNEALKMRQTESLGGSEAALEILLDDVVEEPIKVIVSEANSLLTNRAGFLEFPALYRGLQSPGVISEEKKAEKSERVVHLSQNFQDPLDFNDLVIKEVLVDNRNARLTASNLSG